MAKSYLSDRVAQLKPSGIRKFFDIAASMKEVIFIGHRRTRISPPQRQSCKPAFNR